MSNRVMVALVATLGVSSLVLAQSNTDAPINDQYPPQLAENTTTHLDDEGAFDQMEGKLCAKDRRHLKRKFKKMMFSKIDANDDGVITLDEAVSEAEARFLKMDEDGSGTVTKEEVAQHHLAMKRMKKQLMMEQ